MSRMVRQVCGEYIDGPNGGSFTVRTIPAPPESQPYETTRYVKGPDGQLRPVPGDHGMLLRYACPHCLKDVDIAFPAEDRTLYITEDALDSMHRSESRARGEADRLRRALYQIAVERWMSAMLTWKDTP